MTQATETTTKSSNPVGVVKRTNAFFIDPLKIRRREGWNPRFDFGDIEELASGIEEQYKKDGIGIMQPIRVKRLTVGDDGFAFELIDGDRRLTAAQRLIAQGRCLFENGIPAILEDKASTDLENLIKMFVLNEGKPFLPLEEAYAYKRMRDLKMTYEQIGKAVGRNHVHVVDTLRLLEADPEVIEAMKAGSIGSTTAKAIAKVGDKGRQRVLVDKAKAAKGKKGEARKLKRELEDSRTNKKAATKSKLRPLDPDELLEKEKFAKEELAALCKATGIQPTKLLAEIKGDDQLSAAATYGFLIGIQCALGHKVSSKF